MGADARTPVEVEQEEEVEAEVAMEVSMPTQDRCDVSWIVGDIWLAFPFQGYIFDNRKR